MLLSSEHSLALLFHRSYGRHLYAQHTLLFSGLFSRIRDYYEKSGGGLDDALADFWAQLLERIFPVLHPQYSFSNEYLFCLTRFATSAEESLKPFGDSPRRLRQQVRGSQASAAAALTYCVYSVNPSLPGLRHPLFHIPVTSDLHGSWL